MHATEATPGWDSKGTIVRLLQLAALVSLTSCGGGDAGADAATAVAASPPPAPAPAINPQPTAVGVPDGTVVTQSIGAAGGTIASADGAIAVTLPPGALASNTTIGIQPITNFAINGVGPAYRLTPEGTTFAQPVTLTFAYSDALTAGSAPEALEIATQDAQGYWRMAQNPTRDLNAKTISASIAHFSDWSPIQGLQLLPRQASVRVNGTQNLDLFSCDELPGSDPLLPSLYECALDLATADTVGNWAVNGAPGGTNGTGLVVANGQWGGRYTAPPAIPKPNTVSVNASTHTAHYGTLIILSNITIAGDGYAGTVDLPAGDNGGTYSAQHVEVAWSPVVSNPLVALEGVLYEASGYWTTTVTPPAQTGCDSQTVTLNLDKDSTSLAVYGGTSQLAGKYVFSIFTETKIVTFTCNGVAAPAAIRQELTFRGCPEDAQNLVGAPTYSDANVLAASAPSFCGSPITATWSFKPH